MIKINNIIHDLDNELYHIFLDEKSKHLININFELGTFIEENIITRDALNNFAEIRSIFTNE